jgi:hypothetical protein
MEPVFQRLLPPLRDEDTITLEDESAYADDGAFGIAAAVGGMVRGRF